MFQLFIFSVTGQFFWTFSEDENVEEIVDSCFFVFSLRSTVFIYIYNLQVQTSYQFYSRKITYHEAKLILVVVKFWYTLARSLACSLRRILLSSLKALGSSTARKLFLRLALGLEPVQIWALVLVHVA